MKKNKNIIYFNLQMYFFDLLGINNGINNF